MIAWQNEEWQVRCKLFNQWGQLTHAPVYYAVVVNITYHVLDEALGEKMHEVGTTTPNVLLPRSDSHPHAWPTGGVLFARMEPRLKYIDGG